MSKLILALLPFLLLFGSVALMQYSEKRGLIKPGTTRRQFIYEPSDGERGRHKRVLIGILISMIMISAGVYFFTERG